MIFLQIPVPPFALGVYLPLSLSAAIMVGRLVMAYVNRSNQEMAQERGILLASGLIGGDACIGIWLAFAKIIPIDKPGILPDWTALVTYGLLAIALGYFSLRKKER